LKKNKLCKLFIKVHLEEGVKVVEALKEEEEDEGDKTLTRPLWSVITVIS
jgi:hypothetical protein